MDTALLLMIGLLSVPLLTRYVFRPLYQKWDNRQFSGELDWDMKQVKRGEMPKDSWSNPSTPFSRSFGGPSVRRKSSVRPATPTEPPKGGTPKPPPTSSHD